MENTYDITDEELENIFSGDLTLENNSSILNKTTRIEISTLEKHLFLNLISKLASKKATDETISVIEFLSSSSTLEIVFKRAKVHYSSDIESYLFFDPLYLIHFIFKEHNYYLTVQTVMEKPNHGIGIRYNYITLENTHNGKLGNCDLVNYLRKKSYQHSPFNNRVIKIKRPPSFDEELLTCLKITEVKPINLDQIFIPELKKQQFERFINAVNNYDEDKVSMRILLNGQPGTGKSQLINAVINHLKDKITIFIYSALGNGQGREITFNEVIDFCNHFNKCILIIDDLDLFFSDRERNSNKKELQLFLSYLDGYFQNNLFLLASTNDKTMVDIAASRPGRFDLILDIDEIDQRNYQSLIQRETDDEQIISFFTTNLLSNFAMKKVTGAYIVSFIKQLKSLKRSKGDINETDFNDYMNLTYNGFYKTNSQNINKAVGF